MPHHAPPHRVPRAHIDPIRSAADALALIGLAMQRPLQAETIGFLLDDAGFGDTVVVISGTHDPDSVLAVADCLATAGAGAPTLMSLVLATVRPVDGILPGDIDRWLEASDIVDDHGLQLLEWFVIGPSGIECPRDVFGEPERW